MATRTGSAVWEGTLKEGRGTMKLGSGAFEGPFSFSSRFEEAKGTNPEELIGAAEAGCFSMALAFKSRKGGSSGETHQHDRDSETGTWSAAVQRSRSIDLKTEAEVPGYRRSKIPRASRADEKDLPGLRRFSRHADQPRREVGVGAMFWERTASKAGRAWLRGVAPKQFFLDRD